MIIHQDDQVFEKKLVLLGSSTVGKTSILNRYMRDTYSEQTVATVGTSIKSKTITIDNFKVKLQIWDTGGHERFRSLTPMYFHDADACIIVYDITSKQSFDEVKYWLKDLDEKGPQEVLIALVGNKSDLDSLRVVLTVDGQGFAEKNNISIFMETSAQSGENITELFTEIANGFISETQSQFRHKLVLKKDEKEKNCC